jgi:hypothetical protein
LRIVAQDLSKVEIIQGMSSNNLTRKPNNDKIITTEEVEWFEKRKNRKISRSLLNSVDIR